MKNKEGTNMEYPQIYQLSLTEARDRGETALGKRQGPGGEVNGICTCAKRPDKG